MEGIFWWVIFPYLTLAIMIIGSIYRFASNQISWVAPSTEFFEKKWLKIGSPLFHYGILLAFIGHVMGMLIPIEFYQWIGVSDHMYHFGAIYGGGLAGLMVVAGAIILLIRKMTIDRLRIHATFADWFSVISLIIVAGIGVYMTIIYNTTVVEYEYRLTIGPWFRSLFIFQPQYKLMLDVPLIFKIHVITAFALFASIPFTRLVHLYSAPIHYPMRAPQQYRSRSAFKRKGI
ncbi:respiratory nitrate reductase subunit gamma [Saliterribacillus persicus]|uniref:Nitrate reductase gamma subunit n=1 Tax=Saliterribacillus persicus TaxID=930114 RepID=A0A368XG99_9BACI|nr:respiratory nitrate reductase subunit gamma [Saliterribacillus persicus]RCW67020.1 nitrate reductase gamma subunit [Saliterribacillus persicus]